MILSKQQVYRFWREWSAACQVQGWTTTNGWTPAQIDNERHSMLRRAGFDSLTEVDKSAGFTAVLKELAILRENIQDMVHADANPRRQALHLIHQYSAKICRRSPANGDPDAYIRKIAQDKFGQWQLDQLTEPQLAQLRDTLADRAVTRHHQSTKDYRSEKNRERRANRAAAGEPGRVKFPDLSSPSQISNPEISNRTSLDSEESFPDQVEFAPDDGYELESASSSSSSSSSETNTPF